MIRKLIAKAGAAYSEYAAGRRTFGELCTQLETSGQALLARAAQGAADDDANRRQLRHVIGIERWGQRRLRTFLGEPTVTDEYDGYCPPATLTLADLAGEFRTTRQDTVAIGRRLEATDPLAIDKVVHNDFGPLSAKAWLHYLELHARLEGWRLKA